MTDRLSAAQADALLARDIDRHGEPSGGSTSHDRVAECMRDHRDSWVVFQYRWKFNGGLGKRRRQVKSDYSRVRCNRCYRIWRTKAKYVEELPVRVKGKS